jgi:HAE1 family hydrophobic/amphiphilic exporter-1
VLDGIFNKKVGFLLLVAVLSLAGVLLVTELPIQLYPQTQRPRVRARIYHAGISAVDFADEYADDIESRLLAVTGVDVLEVEYENDQSSFTLTFDWKSDAEKAKSDVEAAMVTVSTFLPTDLRDRYDVRFFSGENAGYLMMGASSPTVSPEELYRMLDVAVLPRLNRVEDAELVELFSVEELTADVTLRQMDMLAYGLTIQDVEAAMLAGYRPESVGRLAEGDDSYSVRFRTSVDSIYDLGRLSVAQMGNLTVRLQDVADITIRYAVPGRAFVMDGARGIRITASPIDGGNVRKMSQDVQAALVQARVEGLLPEDTVFHLYLDPAEYIDRSISNVARSALLGAALAMLIVLLTLGELRNTLLIGISLPLTLIVSFVLMYFFGVSLNLISLGGIALAVGMVIDSSIVVMENIHRLRRADRGPKTDLRLRELVIGAVRQVRAPVIASTLTTVLVFLPLSFTAPLTNAILGDQAKTVVFALLISMVVALTVLPLVAYLLYRGRRSGSAAAAVVGAGGAAGGAGDEGTPRGAAGGGGLAGGGSSTGGEAPRLRGLARLSDAVMGFFRELYKSMLRGLIRRRWATVLFMLVSFGLLAFAILRVLPEIPKEIISAPSSDRIVIFFRNTTLTEPEDVIRDLIPVMDRQIQEAVGPYVESTYADVFGRFNRYFVNLKSTEDADRVLAELQKLFVSDNTSYYNAMMWDPAQLPLPRTMDLQISVFGDDPAEAIKLLERVRDLVNETELYSFVFTDPNTSFSDELTMTARSEVIDGFPGMNESGLLTLVRKILGGTNQIEFDEGQTKVAVSAVYPEAAIEGRHNLENFLIPYRQSAVPLKHFFDFREVSGVSGIASEDGERIFRLYARMAPGTPAARRAEYESRVREVLGQKLTLPAGYSISIDNPQVELDDAIRSLFVALAASVVLIYLLLAFQFNSLTVPLVILVTVPLGFIGVAFSLYLFGSTLSLNSMLGTILLAGIVVNNAIILIDFYLKMRHEHSERIEALVEVAGLRFTPIVITTLTTIFGMLPIAIGLGEGSNIVQPLGIAVSGGLLISTLFTLFMVPAILSFMRVGETPSAPPPPAQGTA